MNCYTYDECSLNKTESFTVTVTENMLENFRNLSGDYNPLHNDEEYALLGLMKALSVEYADRGIMVNGISPSMMETKFLKDVPELIVQQAAMNSPFGRNLLVEEIVPAFEFLLSEGGDRITGQNIVISGGSE